MQYFLYIILAITSFLWFYRLTPYLSSDIPLGYDPWIYKAYFDEMFNTLPNISLLDIDKWMLWAFEPWIWFINNIFQIIGFSSDFILSFWLVFFSIITGFFVYLVLKNHWKATAILWLSIYFISIVQYKAFWWNYYKQIIWILFLLSTIYMFQKQKYMLAIPLIISMFIINRASWVFFVLMFGFYKIYEIIRYKKLRLKDIGVVLLSWILSIWIYFPIIKEQILNLITPLITTIVNDWWTSGTFFTSEEFWVRSIFLLLLSFWGVYIIVNQILLEKKKLELLHFWYLVWLLWTTFGLFFYNRLYINFDIFIIIFAAIFLWYLFDNYKKIFIVVASLFFVLQSYGYLDYVKNNSNALIDQIEFDKIKEISTLIEEDAMIMVTHKNYSPWLIWYARRDVIAPWLFDWNKWSLEDWKKWWGSDWSVKCEMLKDYSEYENLYLWIWKRQPRENLDNQNCMTTISNWDNFIFLKINHE